ncbi:MAG: cation transporter [Candidatus Dormibacteraeota bacterium]|nr:cation transporter [Candidatus Dormibacteraeota bacterium]
MHRAPRHLRKRRLAIVLAIGTAILSAEVAGAVAARSVALLADAGHVLTDVAGLGLALLAMWFAERPASPERSFGYQRLEILAAAANAAVLLAVGVLILVASVARLIAPVDVGGRLMLIVGAGALLGNGASTWLLSRDRAASMNMRGAHLEVASDLLAAAAVVVAAVIILITGFTRADSIASLLVGLVILPRTMRLLRDAADVLLEAAPRGVDIAAVRQHILEVPGVVDAHDLHVWSIGSGMNVVSVHVVKAPDADAGGLLDCLCDCLADHFDIEHSTFQIEAPQHREHERATHD